MKKEDMTRKSPGRVSGKLAQIWVSAILYILIITVVLVIVLNAGVPVLENLQDKTVFTRSKNTFLTLNQHISEISEEGIGSQRVVPIEIEKGNLELKDGSLKWDMRTDAKILESGQQIELGNLHISSNADVDTSEEGAGYTGNYTLENTYLRAVFYKCEDESVCVFDGDALLLELYFKDPDTGAEIAASGTFEFDLNATDTAWPRQGYSVLEDSGTSLGESSVLYYIEDEGNDYYTVLEFTLGSNRDFLEARIR